MKEISVTRRAALWIGAVFVLGVALGGVLGFVFARHAVAAENAPMPEAAKRAHRVEQLTRDLGLSSQQAQQLDAILSQVHAEYKGIHTQQDQQLDQARKRGRDQIRAILTPEQKPKFEEFLRHRDEERKRNEPSRERGR
jgi:Spy/CpxP family protein refolding chaperone